MVGLRYEELNTDPDSYLGLARSLAAGRGYSIPGSRVPTAFRPPLYPLLLSVMSTDSLVWARGGFNVLLGVAGGLFVWLAAVRFGFGPVGRCLAAAVFLCDPLLLRYSSLPMTESLCACLSAMLIWQLAGRHQLRSRESLLTGLLFGLCVLSRPTYWGFAGLLGVATLLGWWRRDRNVEPAGRRQPVRAVVLTCLGAVLVVAPWVIRNLFVLGHPVVMTTHGGYTILLGNNAAFYKEVVNQPWGTVWDGSRGAGQAVWADNINRQLDQLGLHGEVERSRWMTHRAVSTIRQHPQTAIRAMLLRFVRFWNVVPSGPAADGIPRLLKRCVGIYYCALWMLLLLGGLQVVRGRVAHRKQWGMVILLVVSFSAIHLIYWSNVRMRAPIVPGIALLAALPLDRWSRNRVTSPEL